MRIVPWCWMQANASHKALRNSQYTPATQITGGLADDLAKAFLEMAEVVEAHAECHIGDAAW